MRIENQRMAAESRDHPSTTVPYGYQGRKIMTFFAQNAFLYK